MTNHYESLELDYYIRKWLIKENRYKGEAKKHLDEKIVEHKRKYRDYLKHEERKKYLYPGTDGNGYGEIVAGGGDYDGMWQKIFFAGERWTEEEKQEFIEENWVHYKWSPYDCTGQIFTWAIDVFNVPSGVVAYIRDAMDV